MSGRWAEALPRNDATLRWRALPADVYELRVVFLASRAAVYATVTVSGEPLELVVREPASASLRVRVLDERGDPAVGAPLGVLVEPRSAGTQRPGEVAQLEAFHEEALSTGPDGLCLLRGLPAGRVRVRTWRLDERGYAPTHEAGIDVSVAPGDPRDVELRLVPAPPR